MLLHRTRIRRHAGFSLVELMVAVTLGLVVLAALTGLFMNASRNSREMAAVNGIIENGRVATQLLENDVVHAGYMAGFIPYYDQLSANGIPGDVPAGVGNPCTTYGNWDFGFRRALVAMPIQTDSVLPAGAGCVSPVAKKAGTDYLMVRHAETCVPGVGTCPAIDPNQLYFEVPNCRLQRNATSAQVVGYTINSIQLAPTASSVNDIYRGVSLRTVAGTGANQYRLIGAYDGATKIATLTQNWTTIPDASTTYSFEYRLGLGQGPSLQGNCVTPVTPRRYTSNIYYISNFVRPDRPAEVVPTLVRSNFALAGGNLAYQAPERLIEGIEEFRVEVGIDDTMARCVPITGVSYPVNYAQAPSLVQPTTCAVSANASQNTLRTNRGDGAPDRYKRCSTATPCTPQELANVVSVKVYMLVRAIDQSPGYTDAKTYCLGETDNAGNCPAANQVGPFNDPYKRHAFNSTIRLINTSGRRETPPTP